MNKYTLARAIMYGVSAFGLIAVGIYFYKIELSYFIFMLVVAAICLVLCGVGIYRYVQYRKTLALPPELVAIKQKQYAAENAEKIAKQEEKRRIQAEKRKQKQIEGAEKAAARAAAKRRETEAADGQEPEDQLVEEQSADAATEAVETVPAEETAVAEETKEETTAAPEEPIKGVDASLEEPAEQGTIPPEGASEEGENQQPEEPTKN